jgi:hypothetical protein
VLLGIGCANKRKVTAYLDTEVFAKLDCLVKLNSGCGPI